MPNSLGLIRGGSAKLDVLLDPELLKVVIKGGITGLVFETTAMLMLKRTKQAPAMISREQMRTLKLWSWVPLFILLGIQIAHLGCSIPLLVKAPWSLAVTATFLIHNGVYNVICNEESNKHPRHSGCSAASNNHFFWNILWLTKSSQNWADLHADWATS